MIEMFGLVNNMELYGLGSLIMSDSNSFLNYLRIVVGTIWFNVGLLADDGDGLLRFLGGSLAAAHQGGGQQTESKLSKGKRNGEFRNVNRANKQHLEIVPRCYEY